MLRLWSAHEVAVSITLIRMAWRAIISTSMDIRSPDLFPGFHFGFYHLLIYFILSCSHTLNGSDIDSYDSNRSLFCFRTVARVCLVPRNRNKPYHRHQHPSSEQLFWPDTPFR